MYFLGLLQLVSSTSFEYVPSFGQPPERRLYSTMQYEPDRHQLIVCCGQEKNTLVFDDLWDFDLTTETWTFHPLTESVHPRTC